MSEIVEVAKAHIGNVVAYVLSNEFDVTLSEVEALLFGEEAFPRYKFSSALYTYRNVREKPWGAITGRLLRDDVVEVRSMSGNWGEIGRAWLSGAMTVKHDGDWVYMGSMVKL
ncbi:MAG: hypothetical protein ABFS03_09125 [Chloroflexota bacterium]